MKDVAADLINPVDLSAFNPGDWVVTMRMTDNGMYAGFDLCNNPDAPERQRRVAIILDGQMPHQRANARILASAPKMLKMLRHIDAAASTEKTPPAWLAELKPILTEV